MLKRIAGIAALSLFAMGGAQAQSEDEAGASHTVRLVVEGMVHIEVGGNMTLTLTPTKQTGSAIDPIGSTYTSNATTFAVTTNWASTTVSVELDAALQDHITLTIDLETADGVPAQAVFDNAAGAGAQSVLAIDGPKDGSGTIKYLLEAELAAGMVDVNVVVTYTIIGSV